MKSLGSFETSTNIHSATQRQNLTILENSIEAPAKLQAATIPRQLYKHFSEM